MPHTELTHVWIPVARRNSFSHQIVVRSIFNVTLLMDLDELLAPTRCGLQQSAGATKSRNSSLWLVVVAVPLGLWHVARAEVNFCFVSGCITTPEIVQGVHWQWKQRPIGLVVHQRLSSDSIADYDVGTELGEVLRQCIHVAGGSCDGRLSSMLWS